MSDAPEDVSHAPKFHKDRSHYADALRTWFTKHVPGSSDVQIGDLDIPVATGFSNETIFFNATWNQDGERHEQRFVGHRRTVAPYVASAGQH